MKWVCQFILCFCAMGGSLFAQAERRSCKLLVLIIASDDLPIYVEDQKVWRSYMHLNPEWVEVYFIKSNPDLKTDFFIDGDVMWIKEEETFRPGILNKTIKAIEGFLPRISTEFDFVLRSNLSSFFVFPRLLNFLQTCRKKGLYTSGGGTFHYGGSCRKWGHGCGFILSSDLAQLLVEHKAELYNRVDQADDELIGDFLLRKKGYSLFDTHRIDLLNLNDWQRHAHAIPSNVFHFRVKNHEQPERRLSDDLFIYKQLLGLFYPHVRWPCDDQ